MHECGSHVLDGRWRVRSTWVTALFIHNFYRIFHFHLLYCYNQDIKSFLMKVAQFWIFFVIVQNNLIVKIVYAQHTEAIGCSIKWDGSCEGL